MSFMFLPFPEGTWQLENSAQFHLQEDFSAALVLMVMSTQFFEQQLSESVH